MLYHDLVQRFSNMRLNKLLFVAALLTAGNLHAGSIQYEVSGVGTSPTGDPIYRFTYLISGVNFLTDQELEIRFDPALYGALSNATAGAGFDVLLFQPNNPLGTDGIYSALALIDNPSLATPFGVDAIYLGLGTPPSQEFFINQFDSSGNLVRQEEQGTTVLVGEIPEPSTFASVGMLLGLIGCWWTVRRRFRRAA